MMVIRNFRMILNFASSVKIHLTDLLTIEMTLSFVTMEKHLIQNSHYLHLKDLHLIVKIRSLRLKAKLTIHCFVMMDLRLTVTMRWTVNFPMLYFEMKLNLESFRNSRLKEKQNSHLIHSIVMRRLKVKLNFENSVRIQKLYFEMKHYFVMKAIQMIQMIPNFGLKAIRLIVNLLSLHLMAILMRLMRLTI